MTFFVDTCYTNVYTQDVFVSCFVCSHNNLTLVNSKKNKCTENTVDYVKKLEEEITQRQERHQDTSEHQQRTPPTSLINILGM